MALILARLLATTRSCRLWEVRTGLLRSLLSPISLLVRALGLRLLSSQAACPLRSPQRLGDLLSNMTLLEILGENAPVERIVKFLKDINIFYDI